MSSSPQNRPGDRSLLRELYKSAFKRFGGKGLGLGLMNRFHAWAWEKNLKPEEVTVSGLRIFLPRGDNEVAHTLIMEGIYEPAVTRAFEEHLKPGMFLLDLGASFGYYALLGSRLVGPQGRVLAVEPHWENFRLLLRNLEANRCANVFAASLAASDVPSFGSINVSAQSMVFSYAEGRQPCLTVPLDRLLAGMPKPNAAKIDIEGSEMAALKGMKDLLASPELRVLFVECLPSALKAAGHSPEDLLGLLREAGFRTRFLDERNVLCLKE